MKKSFVILPLILTFGLVSCGSNEVLEYSQEDMVLNYSKYELDLNDKFTLSVDNEKLNRKIEWSSSNKDVATVSNSGVVKGLSTGETTILGKYKSLEATCYVTVTDSYAVAVISLDYSEVSLGIDGFVEVNAKTLYKGQEVTKLDYTWSCETDGVVSITPYNNKAVISALKNGETNVFVTTSYNNETVIGMLSVTVIEGLVSFELNGLDYVDGAYNVKVKRNTSVTLDLNVYVDGIKVVDPYFTSSSEDPTIATIEGNVITGLKLGSTKVTVRYKNLGSIVINVTVAVI